MKRRPKACVNSLFEKLLCLRTALGMSPEH